MRDGETMGYEKQENPTKMMLATKIRYHIKSSFFENLELFTSSWLKYVKTKYVSNSTLILGPVNRKVVTSR